MTFEFNLRFRAVVPLPVATALLACTGAQADSANHFAGSGRAGHTVQAQSTRAEVRPCEIEQAKPRPHDPLEPRAVPFERARPVILDAVMYLDTRTRSGMVGMRRAAVSQCPVHKDLWELGVIPRHIDSPRYY